VKQALHYWFLAWRRRSFYLSLSKPGQLQVLHLDYKKPITGALTPLLVGLAMEDEYKGGTHINNVMQVLEGDPDCRFQRGQECFSLFTRTLFNTIHIGATESKKEN
jgi:hypothetical protein